MSDYEPLLNTKLEKAFHQWLDLCPVNFSKQHTSTGDAYIIAFFLLSKKGDDDS